MKKICILMGSPRKEGNTAKLTDVFVREMGEHGFESEVIWLCDQAIEPCQACRCCQYDWEDFGCPFDDDMQEIFRKVLACDLLVFATPIYSWYCTPPLKAAMDRLVYGMDKYYGDEKGPCLWEGKPVALIATCGYRPEKGCELWEEGVKRYCKHANLRYLGLLAGRDMGYDKEFMDEEKEARAKAFADKIAEKFAKKIVEKIAEKMDAQLA